MYFTAIFSSDIYLSKFTNKGDYVLNIQKWNAYVYSYKLENVIEMPRRFAENIERPIFEKLNKNTHSTVKNVALALYN